MKLVQLIRPVAISCLISMPLTTFANSNFVELKAGVDQPTALQGNTVLQNATAATTYVGGIAVGKRFMDKFSVDLEYMNRGKSKIRDYASNGDAYNQWGYRSDSLMLNLSLDIGKISSDFTPYVKLGAGVSRNKSDNFIDYVAGSNGGTTTYNGKTINQFAWQIGTGVNFSITPMYDTQVQYMFVNRGKIETATRSISVPATGNTVSKSVVAQTGKLQDHIITIGIRLKF